MFHSVCQQGPGHEEAEEARDPWTCGGMFANEAGSGEAVNCAFAYNTNHAAAVDWGGESYYSLELWSIRAIEEGEELLTFYGSGFHRDYLIDSTLLEVVGNLSVFVDRSPEDRRGRVVGLAVAGLQWRQSSSTPLPTAEVLLRELQRLDSAAASEDSSEDDDVTPCAPVNAPSSLFRELASSQRH